MSGSYRSIQQATAISLAHLAPTGAELKSIFVDKPGLDVLLELLTDDAGTASEWGTLWVGCWGGWDCCCILSLWGLCAVAEL